MPREPGTQEVKQEDIHPMTAVFLLFTRRKKRRLEAQLLSFLQ